MTPPIVSVVVPVYNIEEYLDRCINSILRQTFSEFELILVDDGSSDDSGTICDSYASLDDRVRVIHKSNGGVSSARNRGIDEASGKYICFVDSDDWVEPDYLSNFMNANPDKYGLVIQSFYYDYEKTGFSDPHILPDKEIMQAADLEFFLEYTEGVHNGFLWHRLFHLDIIKQNNILYPENVSWAEDGVFFLNYLAHSTNFSVISKPGYHYFVRGNSLTTKFKRLPRDLYYFLLNGFANATERIIQKGASEEYVINGLRLYIWRLSYEWLCERSMTCYKDYVSIKSFFDNFSTDHKINANVKGGTLVNRRIRKVMCRPVSRFNYFILRILVIIYPTERRICNKLRG